MDCKSAAFGSAGSERQSKKCDGVVASRSQAHMKKVGIGQHSHLYCWRRQPALGPPEAGTSWTPVHTGPGTNQPFCPFYTSVAFKRMHIPLWSDD